MTGKMMKHIRTDFNEVTDEGDQWITRWWHVSVETASHMQDGALNWLAIFNEDENRWEANVCAFEQNIDNFEGDGLREIGLNPEDFNWKM